VLSVDIHFLRVICGLQIQLHGINYSVILCWLAISSFSLVKMLHMRASCGSTSLGFRWLVEYAP
jgi:hypothetical protein